MFGARFLGATEEPDYGDLLGAVASPSSACRPSGDANREARPSRYPLAPWAFPVQGGYITDLYGWRIRPTTGKKQFHEGLDIGLREGANILAPAAGKVTYINNDPTKSSGRYVTVEHDGGWKSLYLHMLAIEVAVGRTVSAGQRLGLMGQTGQLSDGRPAVTGPHLHWIVKDPCGNVIDPLFMLKGSIPKKGGLFIKGRYGEKGTPWLVVLGFGIAAYFLAKGKR